MSEYKKGLLDRGRGMHSNPMWTEAELAQESCHCGAHYCIILKTVCQQLNYIELWSTDPYNRWFWRQQKAKGGWTTCKFICVSLHSDSSIIQLLHAAFHSVQSVAKTDWSDEL